MSRSTICCSRVRPGRSTDYLRPGEDPIADALLQRITANAPRRRRWSRTTFFVTGACILAGASVTTAVLRSRTADDPTVVNCYATDDIGNAQIQLLAGEADRTAVEQCRELWRDGTFETPVPVELVACVNPNGAVAVLPGTEAACAQHGFDVADVGDGSEPHPATELMGRLSAFADDCFDPEQAIAAATEVKSELALDDWVIDSSRAAEGFCNIFSVEAANRTIVVVADR